TLYKRLKDQPQLREKIGHSVEEHHEIERLLKRLEDGQVTGAAWSSTVSRLVSAVEHHVHEEEHDVFPQAGDILTKQEADDLNRQFKEFKEEELRTLM